jgi:hypothetical protein
MIRLVAFDLDGTLMGSDLHVSDPVRRAIARTLDRGVVVTLATGRMFSATEPFARSLDITAPLICYQGGWVQALTSPVLYRRPLPKPQALKALGLGQARDWHTVLYAGGRLFIDALRHPQDFYERLLGPGFVVEQDLARVLDDRTPDKVLYVADPAEIPAMAPILTGQFGSSVEIVQSHARFIEIVPKAVDKGRALAWLAEHLDIPRASVLAVGDQQNDLPMVRWAGVGVAMGNAVEAVRSAADWVAPPLVEDGAAAVLDRYVLRGPAA